MSTTTPRRGAGLHSRDGRGGAPALLLVALVSLAGLLLGGCGAERTGATAATAATPAASATSGSSTSASPSSSASPASPAGATEATGTRTVPGPGRTVARTAPKALRPVRITIPAIGVDATLTDLGIGLDGAIEVPSDPAQAGWLDTTPAPGQQGPAVIAGHVDSTDGPAVFYRLRDLSVGDAITVTRRNGTTVTFTVDGLRSYAKRAFPTAEVYGPVPGPALRLITCGGDYVKTRGGYLDNLVVYAS